MEGEIDEITDLVGQQLRTSILVGVYLAQHHLERRRQLTAQQTVNARVRLERLDQDRATRIAALERVHSQSFWAYATPAEIRRAWQTALSYRDSDPAAQAAYETITEQLQQRYGVDPTALQGEQPGTDGSAEALRRQDALLAEIQDRYATLADRDGDERLRDRAAEVEQTRAAIAAELDGEDTTKTGERARHDRRETARELLIADTTLDTQAPFDSSGRREQWGRQLRAAGVSETAARAAVLADVCFAQPPEEATRHSAARHAAATAVRAAATVREAGVELER